MTLTPSARRAMRGALACLTLVALSPAVALAQEARPELAAHQDPTTIILVRHAEKAAVPGSDPPLSPAGEARSLALLDALREAGVDAVIVTQLQRTRLTAAPLAAHLGIEPQVVTVSGDVADHARRIAALVLQQHTGRTVLVVGHSNTLPAIVEALGAGRIVEIADDRYDDAFVITRSTTGATRRLAFRYGAGR